MSKSDKKSRAITKRGVNNKDCKELARPQQEYTQEEQRLIDDYLTRSKKKPLKHKARSKKGNIQTLEPEDDRSLALPKMTEALGSADYGLQMFLLNQVVQTFKDCQSSTGFCDDGKIVELCDNAMAILQGIKPQNEIEGMLAVQMVGVHNLAMDTAATDMLSKGMRIEYVQQLLGHASIETTQIYVRILESDLKREMQKMRSKRGQSTVGN
jgi:hypothetical protein